MQPSFDWSQLQRSLKEQYIITQSEAEQKSTFQKKLTSSLMVFHTSFIQYIQQADTTAKSRKKKILKDQGFGDAYTFVKEVILTLSKDFNIMAQIIRRKDGQWSDRWGPISKLIVSNLYQDIVEEDINHKDIMYLVAGLLDTVINGSQVEPSNIKFVAESVSGRILKDFTQRPDIKKYSQMILKSTLLAISKVQQPLNLDTVQPANLNSKAKTTKQEKSSGQLQQNPYKQFSQQVTQNWTNKYALILKQYDKIKGHLKSKQPQCWYVSKHLLTLLGVSDQSSLPSFELFKTEPQPEPFVADLSREKKSASSSFKSEQLSDDLSVIRNIICCFFGEVFKYIYTLPTTVRYLCKIIQQILVKRDPSVKRAQVLGCVGNFLFKAWLLPELKYHDKVMAIGLIDNQNTKNAQIIQQLITRIIRGDKITKDRPYIHEINRIVTSLKESVDNYLQEILKVDRSKVQNLMNKVKEERIRSHSICLNYQEMRTIFELILETEEHVATINDKIVNRVKRVRDMTNNFELFKGRQDKQDGQYYDGTMAYVLFSQLNLPKDLQTDFYKSYVETYKGDKTKNLLRQILVSLDTTDISLLKRKPDMERFLNSLQKSGRFKQDYANIDRIPLLLKVQYLASLKIQAFQLTGVEMMKEFQQRRPGMNLLYGQTKKQFLGATDSVRRYNQKVTQEQAKLHINNRVERLKMFLSKTNINLCISSPKSRENDSSYKTLLAKNPNVADRQKLWCTPQSVCYHASSNLQFVKSLTGQPKKDDKLCHCPDINKFLDVFSQLLEVRSCVVTGEDKVGIRTVFFESINHIISLMKADYKSNVILLEDENWLGQNLQRLMTRRIYQRIYPKHMTYNDAALYFRIKTLEWVTPEHLNIQYNIQTDPLWRIAASRLNQIDNFKTPAEKMQCIVACSQTMDHILRLTMDNNDPANADTTTPLIQYIILKAAPRRFYSNMNFISIFSQCNKMMSGQGYSFTQFQCGINFLEILDETRLSNITKLEYQKVIYDKETEYGLYFLKRRPRADRQPFDQKKYRDIFKSYLQQ